MLSNSFVGAREREQQAHGLEDMCDVIVYSHEAGFVKPDAQIYLMDMYAQHGFVRDGADFVDDGVPHVPMLKPGIRHVGPS